MRLMLTLFVLSCVVGYSREFTEMQLNNHRPVMRMYIEDVNGDELADIITLNLKREANGKAQFSVFLNRAGTYPEQPNDSLEISPSEVIFDFADVLPGGGAELLSLGNDSLYIYQIVDGKWVAARQYAMPNPLFAVPTFRNPAHFPFAVPLSGEEKKELLVPTGNTFELHAWQGDKLEKNVTLASMGIANYSEQSLSPGNESDHSLNVDINTPNFQISDVNADGANDILFFSGALLDVYLQKEGKFKPLPDYRSSLTLSDKDGKPVILNNTDREQREYHELVAIIDINKDGAPDLLIKKVDMMQSIFDPKSQIKIYYGKLESKALSFSATPDKIIVSSGLQFTVNFDDVDGDGFTDLVIPTMELGLFKIISILVTRSATINVNFYRNDDGFPDAPSVVREMSWTFEFSGDSRTPIFDFSGDFNGDGRRDLVSSPEEGWLGIHYGGGENLFNEDPDEEYEMVLPSNGFNLEVEDLNNDGLSDIIMRFNLKDDRENDPRYRLIVQMQQGD
jgi:hypothetical protein